MNTGKIQWQNRIEGRAYIIAGLLLGTFAIFGALNEIRLITQFFLIKQDIILVILSCIFYIILSRFPNRISLGSKYSVVSTPGVAALLALAVLTVGIVGHFLLLSGHALSRDEQMALMDSKIFAAGHLAYPLPESLAGLHHALNSTWIPMPYIDVAWKSQYLPVNAALHAPFIASGTQFLVGPICSALAILFTWLASERIWPDNRQAQLVATVITALNAQVLVNAMTAYAMPFLLAANMAWLWLFLLDRPWSHTLAILLGVAATGSHQLAYHPAFALPFCTVIVWQRRWILATIYLVTYCITIFFWANIDGAILATLESEAIESAASQRSIVAVASGYVANISEQTVWILSANLSRFFTWQHVLLLPLMVVGSIQVLRSRNPIMIAILASFALCLAMKFALRPFQGHGWGYRYLHGEIGVAAMVAAYGWIRLREVGSIGWRHFIAGSAFTAAIAIPWSMTAAYRFSHPFHILEGQIASSKAKVVIVPDYAAPFAQDLVLNDPFSQTRPLRFKASKIDPNMMGRLCEFGPVWIMDEAALQPIADMFDSPIQSRQELIKSIVEQSNDGCLI